MPIQVTCQCGKQYAAKDEWAGRSLRCKSCGSVVRVPEPEIDLGAVELRALEAEPPPAPLQPVRRPKPAAARQKVLARLSALGAWKIPAVAAALMIGLLIPGLLIKALLGPAVLIGFVASGGYLLCGLGLWVYRVFEIAGKEGMLFHVLLWTRAGRRFVYAQWRHYGKAALMMLQGVLLSALTVLVFLVVMVVRPPRSEEKEAPPAVATEELSAEEIQKIEEEFDAIHAEQERIHDEIRAKAQRRREEGKSRLAEFRKRAHVSPEDGKQPLIDKYGAHRVVTVIVEQAPVSTHAALVARIRSLAGTTQLASHGSGDRLWLATGPVTDLAVLAAKIDFGQDVQVDEAQRTITVVADPGKLE